MSESPSEIIGFIGIGRMGTPMISRLVQAEYTVRAFDLSPEARERAADLGATVAEDLSSAMHDVPVVILMLPNSAAVSAVLQDETVRRDSGAEGPLST